MNIVIVGGSGGIGRAFVRRLAARDRVRAIHATFNQNRPQLSHPKVTWQPLDVTRQSSVRTWAETLGDIDLLINAVGVLHTPAGRPEKTVRRFEADFFLHNIRVNTLPTLLLARFTQDKFTHGRPAVFATVSARVGSIQDNRLGGWYSYRASKAALNMCIRTLALEWKRVLPKVSVCAIHPGTTDTALSGPFQKNVPRDKLFSADHSATCMLDVLDGLTPEMSGQFLAYDGREIPW